MPETLTAIGLMSDASLGGIDAAILTTDGEDIVDVGPSRHSPYSRDLKIWMRRAIRAVREGREGAAEVGKAAGEVTLAHVKAVEALLEAAHLKRRDVDVIGLHGHTVLHQPATQPGSAGRSWQLGDGRVLADEVRIDVVSDFRRRDVVSGGAGAPLSPVYDRARIATLADQPRCAVGVIHLGDVATMTYVPEGARPIDLVAFDCGPGMALVNEWAALKTGEPADREGALVTKLASAGAVNEEALRMLLLAPYLRRSPPKSLGRYDFKTDHLKALSPEDGVATLAAFTAACIAQSAGFFPEPPGGYIVCGNGRRNPAMMQALKDHLDADVVTAEEAGWRGAEFKAECFAYLAVRSLKKLPFSYPMTTSVRAPLCGGVHYRAPVFSAAV